jgi:hypothetical protein
MVTPATNYAFSKRFKSLITLRQGAFYFYKKVRHPYRQFKRQILITRAKKPESLFFYPCIHTPELLSDVVNRFCWAFPTCNIPIYIPVSNDLLGLNIDNLITPKAQHRYICKRVDINLVPWGLHQVYYNSDFILVHDTNAFVDLNLLARLDKSVIVDKFFYSDVETQHYLWLYEYCLTPDDKIYFDSLSNANFRRFLIRHKGKSASYLFTSGPSFDIYATLPIDIRHLKIVCNSIIRHDKFLSDIEGPDAVVFADPVFHFGPSIYAHRFREDMMTIVQKYDCYVFTDQKFVPLLLRAYPALRDRLVGFKKTKKLVIPSPDERFVTASSNILTFIMLPIAMAATDFIYVIGADGRAPGENYFWKHSTQAQYHDLMETVFDTHPSFFRDRVYEDYYQEHCRHLEQIISFGEKKGKSIQALTSSYIPALRKRMA